MANEYADAHDGKFQPNYQAFIAGFKAARKAAYEMWDHFDAEVPTTGEEDSDD
jgi:hypothetical protein